MSIILGMIIADAGYLGKGLFNQAREKGIHLFTCVKASEKNYDKRTRRF
ncbi:transposase [Patescibacteria group bacterium]|nr:transposase [Patescibacteria group bacterium]